MINFFWFNKKSLILIIALLGFVRGALAAADGTTAITRPALTLSYEKSETTVGGTIGKSTLKITDGSTPIRSKFKYTYTIIDAHGNEIGDDANELTNVKGKETATDPTTGSSVQYRYGVVTIGKKRGTFKVKVTATPTDNYKSTYSTATATFDVKVDPVTTNITASLGANTLTNDSTGAQIHVYTYNNGTTWSPMASALPTVTLTSGGANYTSYYTITYVLSDASKFSFLDADNKVTTDDTKKAFLSTTAQDATSTTTLIITATPKDDSKAFVGDESKVFTAVVDVRQISSNENKIKTHFEFPSHEITHYRMAAEGETYVRLYDMPEPVIKDENGNDVTKYFDIKLGYTDDNGDFHLGKMKPQSVFYKYSGNYFDHYSSWQYSRDPNTSEMVINNASYSLLGNGAIDDLSKIQISTNESQKSPDDYIFEVKATACKGDASRNIADYSKIYSDPVVEDVADPVKGMFYGREKDATNGTSQFETNKYTIKSNQIVYHCLKREPKLNFTPDPTTVTLATSYEMVPDNRFILEGSFTDKTLVDQIGKELHDTLWYKNSGFTYCIFIPKDNLWQSDADNTPADGTVKIKPASKYWQSWTNSWVYNDFSSDQKVEVTGMYVDKVDANGNIVYNADGLPEREKKDGILLFTKRGWSNDDFCITFYGKGKINLGYYILPSNAQSWDVGSAQSVTFTVVDQEPTYLHIIPKDIITSIGQWSTAPSVKVYDQFGADVTTLFNLTTSRADKDSWKWNLGNDSNTEDGKYQVKSDSYPGEYDVIVSATTGSTAEVKHFTTPTFNSKWGDTESTYNKYTVHVKEQQQTTSLYEIIYDENEFKGNETLKLNDKVDANGNRTIVSSKMGKLHFIGAGSFLPGTVSSREIPGINVIFGTADEAIAGNTYKVVSQADDTSLKDNDNDKAGDGTVTRYYLNIDNTNIPDGSDIPDRGYIGIQAITNGYLTIDAKIRSGETWILRDLDTDDEQDITSATETTGERHYRFALLSGHSYALWSNQMQGYIHGMSFDPEFISLSTDETGWHTAVAFLNGYTGTLPRLLTGTSTAVTYKLIDTKAATDAQATELTAESGATDVKGYHASVGASTGQVAALNLTTDGKLYNGKDGKHSSTGVEMDNRIVIIGEVTGLKKSENEQVRKRPHYNLYIGNMPTYIVEDGANFDQGNRISTNNIPTRIWMTMGGWLYANDTDHPYRKSNSRGDELIDGWKTAKMDSVGRDNMTINNFNYSSFGDQNPLNEDIESWNTFRQAKPWNEAKTSNANFTLDCQRTTFNVPVRGTYLKFEPEESGRLFLYLLQNGLTDIAVGDDKVNPDRWKDTYLRRRAIYIVDETGQNVDIPAGDDGWSDAIDKYLPSGQTLSTRFSGYVVPNYNYYCDGITRIGWSDDVDAAKGYQSFKIDTNAGTKYTWLKEYDHTGKDADAKLTAAGEKNLQADIKTITDWWKTNTNSYTADGARTSTWTHSKLNGPNEVLRLADGSFVLPTKGYVRYTFNVKAGKTYYVFATGSKLGFCGFGFLPQGYEKDATPWLNSTTSASDLLSDNSAFNSSVYEKLPDATATYSNGSAIYSGEYGGETITLDASKKKDDDGSYSKQIQTIINGKKDHQFGNVNLKRSFRNKRWHGICLPFSVSSTQLKEVFGANTQVITFDSIRWDKSTPQDDGTYKDESRTIHFTYHVEQLLEAGRPYFIYPDDGNNSNDGTVLTYKDNNGNAVNGVQFKHVTFENADTMTIVGYNENAINTRKDKDECFTYQIVGTYNEAPIPFYSYYMKVGNSTDADTGNDNNLVRIVPKSATARLPYLPGFNAYLYPYSADASGNTRLDPTEGAKMAGFWINAGEVSGGDITAIDQLVEEINVGQTNFVEGVYTVGGVMVRPENSLKGLAPGVYIMGGKKYTVK